MLRCSTGPRKALIGLLGSFAVLAVFAVVAAQPASAKPTATFTVTNTLDDGSAGSLRWAILQANLAPGFDTINVTANGTVTLVSSQIVISNPRNCSAHAEGKRPSFEDRPQSLKCSDALFLRGRDESPNRGIALRADQTPETA